MAAAYDFKLLLTMLGVLGTVLAAACHFGSTATDGGGTQSSSLPMMGG